MAGYSAGKGDENHNLINHLTSMKRKGKIRPMKGNPKMLKHKGSKGKSDSDEC